MKTKKYKPFKEHFVLSVFLFFALSLLVSGFSNFDDRRQEVQRSLVNSELGLKSAYQYDGIPGVHSMATDGHFLESFEGVTFPPAGWTKINPDGGTGWNRQTAGTSPVPGWGGGVITTPPGGETGTAFCTWTTGGAATNDQWLVTPQIMNVQSDDSLKFWLRYWPNTFRDSIEVLISTSTPVVGNFTTLVWRKNFAVASLDTGWFQYGFRLGNHVSAGSDIYIAFREVVLDNFNDGASFSLDLVEVTSSGSSGLAGDYTIGVALFNTLTGNNLSFEKRTRQVDETMMMNEYYANPSKFEGQPHSLRIAEDGSIEEFGGIEVPAPLDNVMVTISYVQEYYVPIKDGQEYEGPLYHKFTEADKLAYNLGDGIGVYATITAAVADANLEGLSGPTRFLLVDATYPSETFPIIFDEVPGTSSVNTLTLLPDVGVTTTIGGTPANTQIFRINNSSHIIFDGRQDGVSNPFSMTIQNSAATGTASHTIQLINGSTFNTIQYCNILNGAAGTAGPRGIDIGTSAANPSGNSDNLISNCNISGSRSGIGFAGTAANPNVNNIIEYCNIFDNSFAQIWLSSNVNAITIRGNELYNTFPAVGTTATALIIGGVGGTSTNDIYDNMIYNLQNNQTTTQRAITVAGSTGSTWNIYNNFISLTVDNGTKTSIYAIQPSGANGYILNCYYNSFRIGGSHTGGTAGVVVSAGFVKSNTGASSVLNYVNNIVLNERSGGTAGVFHCGSFFSNLAGTNEIDYNTHWATGDPNSFNSGWDGTLYNNLATYKTAVSPQEQNSIFKATNFVSNIDLHLTGASVGDLDLSGTPIPGITTDIDGDIRDATVPYQGADEGAIPLPVDILYFTGTVDMRNVTLSWATAWEENNDRFEIMRKIYDEETSVWSKVGTVSGSGTSYQTKTYSFTDKNLLTGKYEYKLVQYDYNGNTSADFDLNQVVEIGTPTRFDLSQNYPNPFNPVTKIGYDIPVESFVKLAIYDLSGREVAVLVNNQVTPGYYTVDFNAGNLASGVYFYRLTTVNATITKKMMVLK